MTSIRFRSHRSRTAHTGSAKRVESRAMMRPRFAREHRLGDFEGEQTRVELGAGDRLRDVLDENQGVPAGAARR